LALHFLARSIDSSTCSGNIQTKYDSGNEGCYAALNLITFSWDTYPISGPTIFDFPTTIFNHYHNKIVSAQQNTHCIQILCVVPPQISYVVQLFFRGEF